MEKYTQYRDKGSGISPFLPVPTAPSGIYLPFHFFLFVLRVPILLVAVLTYLLIFSWMPFPSVVKKAALWFILAIPGIWWIDLRIDGVRRGDLGRQIRRRLPRAGSIIAANFTSPIDALYLAAIFDPVFTTSFPHMRLVQPITLAQAVFRAFLPPQTLPPETAHLIDLPTLIAMYPDQPIVIMPECTTTNGRGILPLSPSLVTAPNSSKIFPTSLRYNPADVTTPVPSTYLSFLWALCSKPTHTIRVRIAEGIANAINASPPPATRASPVRNSYSTNFLDTFEASEMHGTNSQTKSTDLEDKESVTVDEERLLNNVGDALARLGRVRTVALGVPQKTEFVKMWAKRPR